MSDMTGQETVGKTQTAVYAGFSVDPELHPVIPRTVQLADRLRRMAEDLWCVSDDLDRLYRKVSAMETRMDAIRKEFMVPNGGQP